MSIIETNDDLVDPTTGEILEKTDADALIDAAVRCAERAGELYSVAAECRRLLASMTSGDKKTRRLVTKNGRTLKVEMPDTSFDNAALKEAWNSYPGLAPSYLRIASIEPQRRELAKLRETTGPTDFLQFKNMVLGAERPPSGTPRVTVEKNSTPDSGGW